MLMPPMLAALQGPSHSIQIVIIYWMRRYLFFKILCGWPGHHSGGATTGFSASKVSRLHWYLYADL